MIIRTKHQKKKIDENAVFPFLPLISNANPSPNGCKLVKWTFISYPSFSFWLRFVFIAPFVLLLGRSRKMTNEMNYANLSHIFASVIRIKTKVNETEKIISFDSNMHQKCSNHTQLYEISLFTVSTKTTTIIIINGWRCFSSISSHSIQMFFMFYFSFEFDK